MKKIFFCILILFVFFGVCFFVQRPRLTFVHDEEHIGMYEEIHPYDYIEKISHIDIEELQIKHNVNNKKIGKYDIQYIYKKKIFHLDLYVDDIVPPDFETINKKILKGETIKPTDLVKNIKDETKTKVYFKEDYLFNELKTYHVRLIVEDAFFNKREKLAYVLVEEKDSEPPCIEGVSDLTVLLGEKIDLTKGITIKDDHDLKPILQIDDSSLNLFKEGEYQVYYNGQDASFNRVIINRKITVLSRYANKEAKEDGIKTCYLTFDDGPSSNTEKVLKILDHYHIKATFFVTGSSPKDYIYMKKAYQKGHVIGIHTYCHDYEKIYSSLNNYLEDMNKMKEIIYEQTGIYTHYLRFPGGSSNLVSKKYNKGIMKRLTKKVIDLGYQYYDWTCINGDGEGIESVSELKKKAIEEIGDKEDIMFLMHDSASKENTVKALPYIIDYLIKKGYQFKTIDDYSPTFHHTVQN